MHWRRKWQPTTVFLPGESQGWGSLVGCRLWGRTESDTTEATQQQQDTSQSIIKEIYPEYLLETPSKETQNTPMTQPQLSFSLLLSRFSRVRLCATPETAAHLSRPWDSPGKNTGVGCHFLLQCMKVKSESEVAQSCPTLRDPMDCSLPGSSVHGICQARAL